MANSLIALLARLGLSVRGSQVLAVRGRRSGRWRTTPVNPLSHGDSRYLVAPRGETEWVRNIRASGEGELRLGPRRERVRVVELTDDEKPDVLRAYLQRWRMETGRFFGGASGASPREDLRRISPDHPVFRIVEPVD